MKFLKAAEAAGGGGELAKAPFMALVKVMCEGAAPSDEDLAAAFTLADENRNGTVDVFEFIRLYNLVRAGKVHGLGTMALPQRRQVRVLAQGQPAASAAKEAFREGGTVAWTKADDNLPENTVGRVLCLHDDGDAGCCVSMMTVGGGAQDDRRGRLSETPGALYGSGSGGQRTTRGGVSSS